jgi:hypothetical protein
MAHRRFLGEWEPLMGMIQATRSAAARPMRKRKLSA